MVTIYFSGTENSRYIAERFSEKTNAACFLIEEAIDFGEVLTRANTVTVCATKKPGESFPLVAVERKRKPTQSAWD